MLALLALCFARDSYCASWKRHAIKQPCSGGTMKQRIKTLCAGGLLALALFGVAAAGPLEDAKTAYQKGDYAAARRLIRPLAEQGNALAQDSLGYMYDRGEGVPQDYAQAVVWFRKAADQGDAFAQGEIGDMYMLGMAYRMTVSLPTCG